MSALGVSSIIWAIQASGVSPSEPAASCRASLLRVALGGSTVAEPFVANETGAPCVAEDGSLIGDLDLTPVPLDGKLLYAQTALQGTQAQSGVSDVTLHLSAIDSSLPDITAQVLKSDAAVKCDNGVASLTSSSRVVGLGGLGALGLPDPLVIPPGDDDTPIAADPLITIYPNEEVISGTSVTRRALRINALAGNVEVVVAESQAGYSGNPCVQTTPSPTASPTASPTVSPTASPTASPTSPPPAIVGWMTGGGSTTAVSESGAATGGKAVAHGFVLPCTLTQDRPGPNLTISQAGVGTVKLTSLTSVNCTENAAIMQEQPEALFDTITGTGTGTCKGEQVTISFTFVDGGEPAAGKDVTTIDVDGACEIQAQGRPDKGNHQAHRGANPPA